MIRKKMRGSIKKIQRNGKYIENFNNNKSSGMNGASIYGIKTKKGIRITETQLNLIKKKLSQINGIQYKILISAKRPYTGKEILERMGKGKGKIKGYNQLIPKKKIIILVKPFLPSKSFFKLFPFLC
jgi:ribosomal protein L16/L10AE